MSTPLEQNLSPSIGSALKSALMDSRRQNNFDSDRRRSHERVHPVAWIFQPAVFSFDPMAMVRLTLSFLWQNTPGGVSTKPGKVAGAAEEKRSWLLSHHGHALSKHGWVKPVRFSMVRCPKRLRAKLRPPSPNRFALEQLALSNRCFLPQPGAAPISFGDVAMKNKSMKTDITDLPLPRDPAAEEREAQAALLSNVPKKPTYLDLVKAIQAVDEIVSQPQPGLPPLPPLWADVILRLTRPQVYRLVQHAMHEEQVDAYAEHKLRNPR